MLRFINRLLFKKRNKYAKIDQLRYLSQSALIEESVAPHVVRTTLIMVSIVIIALIVWAGLTQVEEIAITQGEAIPSKHVQSIQHLEGGIVKTIHVIDGELVDEGQVLLSLDEKEIIQELEALKAKQLSLRYDSHRLRSFINQTKPDFTKISPDDTHKDDEEEQMRAFESMIEARESEKEVINQQIDQKNDALDILSKKITTLEKNLVLVGEERDMKKKLTDKGHLSKFKFLQIQKQYNDIVGELNETKSAIVQAQNSLEEYEERLKSLKKTHIDNAYRELNLNESDLAQVNESIERLESLVSRLEIKSPVHGFVKGIKVTTIGGVIDSGQVIMQVVPLEGNLIIESRINPRDIGHVRIGLPVNVKVSAYDFSRYGTVKGTLEYISATTFVDEATDERYYLGRITLKQNYVGKDPKLNLIVPGMTVQADIVTGSKSILAYLLKPIHTSITTAFSER